MRIKRQVETAGMLSLLIFWDRTISRNTLRKGLHNSADAVFCCECRAMCWAMHVINSQQLENVSVAAPRNPKETDSYNAWIIIGGNVSIRSACSSLRNAISRKYLLLRFGYWRSSPFKRGNTIPRPCKETSEADTGGVGFGL